MTQPEAMEILVDLFTCIIVWNKSVFKSYSYNDNRAEKQIAFLKSEMQNYGFKLSNCYHANGIGNNNEYTIYLEDKDKNGFIIKKEIATLYYCYGIYGGCSVYLTDLNTKEQFAITK